MTDQKPILRKQYTTLLILTDDYHYVHYANINKHKIHYNKMLFFRCNHTETYESMTVFNIFYSYYCTFPAVSEVRGDG